MLMLKKIAFIIFFMSVFGILPKSYIINIIRNVYLICKRQDYKILMLSKSNINTI